MTALDYLIDAASNVVEKIVSGNKKDYKRLSEKRVAFRSDDATTTNLTRADIDELLFDEMLKNKLEFISKRRQHVLGFRGVNALIKALEIEDIAMMRYLKSKDATVLKTLIQRTEVQVVEERKPQQKTEKRGWFRW